MRFLFIALAILQMKYLCCNRDDCEPTSEEQITDYFIVAKSYTSKQKEIAKKYNMTSVEDCKTLARKKHGMAFSYKSSPNLNSKNSDIFEEVENKKVSPSCIVYDCPEVENSTSIFHTPGYDYYSIFGDPIPPENATCIPRLGIFVTHMITVNYSSAKQKCHEYGSVLPDVATEIRTNALANMLDNIFDRGSLKEAYVGLENMDKTYFIRSTGEKLSCSTFRAWFPGHPKKLNETCVLLTSNRMWKTIDCKAKKPFICEIYPGGWNQTYEYYDYYNLQQFYF